MLVFALQHIFTLTCKSPGISAAKYATLGLKEEPGWPCHHSSDPSVPTRSLSPTSLPLRIYLSCPDALSVSLLACTEREGMDVDARISYSLEFAWRLRGGEGAGERQKDRKTEGGRQMWRHACYSHQDIFVLHLFCTCACVCVEYVRVC